MWIVEVCIHRPVFTVMLTFALVGLGLIGFQGLGVDLFPRVEFPYVSITTRMEGASPETIETEVTDVIEGYVNNISGIEKLRSISSEGISQITIEFKLDEDADVKAQEVRDKVSLARSELPLDAELSLIEKIDPDAAPLLSVLISGDSDIRTLSMFADEVVKERLQRLPGVGSISIVGDREREIRVWLNLMKLRALGISAEDVVNAVAAEHAQLPGGRLDMSGLGIELGVRTDAEADSIQELANLVIRYNQLSPPTRLRDIAKIEDGMADERTFAILNGKRGVALEVRRQSGLNSVEVARRIRAEASFLQATAPNGIDILVTRDTSRFVESSVDEVTKELQIAMVLVVLITFFFLGSWRSTLIVATAIPTSLIATFYAFDAANLTLNIVTLLALTVAIGLLVDDAIVVIEAIQKDVDQGMPAFEAASEATQRVSLAVLAGTFATLAVFVPIAFMDGIVGQFFSEYGFAIVFSVSISLLVALTLSPMLGSRFVKKTETSGLAHLLERFHAGLASYYGLLVQVAVRWRYLVLLLAMGSVYIGIIIYGEIPGGFTSKADRSEFQGTVELVPGTAITRSKQLAISLDQRIRAIKEVENVFVTIGSGPGGQPNKLDIYGTLVSKQMRGRGQFLVMDEVRTVAKQTIPDARTLTISEVPWVSGGGLSVADIELVLQGDDLDEVRRYANEVVEELAKDSRLSDVRSGEEPGRPELILDVMREHAGDLGIPARSIAMTSRILIGGVDAGTYESLGSRYDINIRLQEEDRNSVDQISQMQVRTRNGTLVDLPSVVDIRSESSPARIERQDRGRKISIFANAGSDTALGDAADVVRQTLDSIEKPEGISVLFEGQLRRMEESSASIGGAFLLAIIALYVVLASQFDSFGQPLIIMLAAPLCFSGAFAGLYLSNQEMSLFAQIGLIALMGIVMKNGILLVDRANQLRDAGHSPTSAITEACPERLRPVLMTASAAIFGMIPVALSNADGSEWRNAMGSLIIGGLTTSTFLTLFVVPAAYMIGPDLKSISRHWKFRSRVD
ncbi:MAG: efflux RND transporter permease subunit, partial [Pseudomonadales bacterium]